MCGVHADDYGAIDDYGVPVTDVAQPTRLATREGPCS